MTRITAPHTLKLLLILMAALATQIATAQPQPATSFWSFQPLKRVAPPAVKDIAWCINPIDRFIRSKQESVGLKPNPTADRSTLIRRLTFDLTGLPPTPSEIDTYLNDKTPDAYTSLVDRLLASPHYGERWARHWLDLARYADSNGFEPDQDRTNFYPYRDFVIRAFNQDLPFNTFVQWQLAGDEAAPENPDALAATGFLAAGPHSIFTLANEGTPREREQMRYDELDDILSTTGSAFLGLTVGCARCHDHKYDPIPQRDYYRMLAAFTTTKQYEPTLPLSAPQPTDSTGQQKPQTTLAVTDTGSEPATSYLLGRGDPERKIETVTVGFLSALNGNVPNIRRPSGAHTTFQRTALADWMTDPDRGAGALVARVIVNRLWQHHFGEGLVRTPSDFGKMGERPSHPELLDYLATELIRNGWHLKPIQRFILTSATYRQSVAYDAARARLDPENRLLWRRRPLRLEAEALRDAILATSGHLDTTLYGPAIKPAVPAEAMAGRNKDDKIARPKTDGPEQWRRTLYLFVKRSIPTPLLETLDTPTPSASCGRRSVSTVPTQALALLNDGFIRNQATLFAQRVAGTPTADNSPAAQIERAYRLALGRPPRPDELRAATAFLNREGNERGMVNLCQILFTLNEFTYID